MVQSTERRERVEDLLDEFNKELQEGLAPQLEVFLRRCPKGERRELRSLLNTLVLANRALEPLRRALGESRDDKE